MGMYMVPWVGNGWVQLTHAQLWVGYGYSCQAQCRTLLNTHKILQQFIGLNVMGLELNLHKTF
jgi:hypothetical protein